MAIKVTTLAGDVREIPFEEGKSVGYYCGKAGATPGKTSTVSVNEKLAGVDDIVTEDNSVVVVALKVSNG